MLHALIGCQHSDSHCSRFSEVRGHRSDGGLLLGWGVRPPARSWVNPLRSRCAGWNHPDPGCARGAVFIPEARVLRQLIGVLERTLVVDPNATLAWDLLANP